MFCRIVIAAPVVSGFFVAFAGLIFIFLVSLSYTFVGKDFSIAALRWG